MKTTVTTTGNSLAVRIPKQLADRQGLRPGAELTLIETHDGIFLTSFDPELEEQMEAIRTTEMAYQSALRLLASR